jgi:hypothetical protein
LRLPALRVFWVLTVSPLNVMITGWDAAKPSPSTSIIVPGAPLIGTKLAVAKTVKSSVSVPLTEPLAVTVKRPPGVEGTVMAWDQLVEPDTDTFITVLPKVNITASGSAKPVPVTVTDCPGEPLVGEIEML